MRTRIPRERANEVNHDADVPVASQKASLQAMVKMGSGHGSESTNSDMNTSTEAAYHVMCMGGSAAAAKTLASARGGLGRDMWCMYIYTV